MVAPRSSIGVLLLLSALCGWTAPQSSSAPSAQTGPPTQPSSPSQENQPASKDQGESSSKSGRRKTHHMQVAEEDAPSPELAQAETLIQKRDYAGAEPLLSKVVTADPANYEAWFDLGFAENGLGKLQDSIAAYRKSVAAKPDVFEPNLNLGLQLAKTGQPDAEQFLRAATQLKPTAHVAEGQARAWFSLGRVLEATKPEEALAAYHEAEKLQPKNAEPHLAAGVLFEKAGKSSEAIEEYKQAFALDPSADAATALANVYMNGHRFPEAETYLTKLVALQPQDAAAHIQLGRVLAAEQKNDAAVAELETGIKMTPTSVEAQRDLADLYTSTGKNDHAEAIYRALLSSKPNDSDLHRALGQSLIRQKKFAEAQQELVIAVKLKPDFGEAYGDLAFAANENKNYPLTIGALDARAKYLPELPTTYFLRASAYDHLKDFKKAAANYHLFLDAANGKYPDQEWQAKHRLIAIEPKK